MFHVPGGWLTDQEDPRIKDLAWKMYNGELTNEHVVQVVQSLLQDLEDIVELREIEDKYVEQVTIIEGLNEAITNKNAQLDKALKLIDKRIEKAPEGVKRNKLEEIKQTMLAAYRNEKLETAPTLAEVLGDDATKEVAATKSKGKGKGKKSSK